MTKPATNTTWHKGCVSKADRENLNRHKAYILWFTGLSGSGKSTIAHAVEYELHQKCMHVYTFDGDNVRHGLCSDLGFSRKDRKENIRRIAEMISLFIDAGTIAITAFISPFKSDRQQVRKILGTNDFIEIYCKCDIDVCESRDVKGLYKKARQGEIKGFTGISSPYEPPESPDLILQTDIDSIEDSVQKVLSYLSQKQLVTLSAG